MFGNPSQVTPNGYFGMYTSQSIEYADPCRGQKIRFGGP